MEGQPMLRTALVLLAMLVTSEAALAQWGPPSGRAPFRPPSSAENDFFGRMFSDDDDDDDRPRRPTGPRLASGGERPSIGAIHPKRISFASAYPVGSIVIDHRGRQLFLVESASSALRYPISVGREGFNWSGAEKISRIANWPDWHPPAEMRERDPSLPEKMTGGIRN